MMNFFRTSVMGFVGLSTIGILGDGMLFLTPPALAGSLPIDQVCADHLSDRQPDSALGAIAEFAGAFLDVTPTQDGLYAYAQADDITRLYDFAGNEKAKFRGNFYFQYDADSPYVVTVVWDELAQTHFLIHDPAGKLLGEVENFRRFTPDYQAVLVTDYDREITQILDFQGKELVTFPGTTDHGVIFNQGILPDGSGVITFSPNSQTFSVYSLDGRLRFSFQGDIIATPDNQGLILFDWDDPTAKIRLVDFEGREKQTFAGNDFQTFTPDQQGLVTYHSGENRTRLYTLEGTERAVMEGRFSQFTPDEQGIITFNAKTETFIFYDLDGTQKFALSDWLNEFGGDNTLFATTTPNPDDLKTTIRRLDGTVITSVPGIFYGFLPNDQGFITYNTQTQRTGFYRFDGTQLTEFVSDEFAFTPDGNQFVTYSWQTTGSRLSTLTGEKVATFPGIFSYFMPSGESAMIYLPTQNRSGLYSLTGELVNIFEMKEQIGLTADETGIIFYSYDDGENNDVPTEMTFITDINGVEQMRFPGYYRGYLGDDQGFLTYVQASDRTYLYCLPAAR